MSAATIIADAFGEGADLYEDVLGVPKTATNAQLRKAYYKKALQFHPDKQQSSSTTNHKFQAISVAYSILKDPEKRAEYDESGELVEQDDDNMEDSKMWRNYFQQVFGKVTTNDIDAFILKYKCSDEEEQDVLKYYEKFEGNLTKMLTCVMASEPRDTSRWVEDYIQPAILKGQVQDYKETLEKTLKKCMAKVDKEDELMDEDEDATESEDSDAAAGKSSNNKKKAAPKKAKATKAKATKKTKAQKEAEAAEELLAKMRNKHVLSQRQAGFDAMFQGIKDRYGVTEDDPLAGDAFEKAQANLNKKKKARK
jgi:DnaJ family protein C protein 9